jgi:hypothetical protein
MAGTCQENGSGSNAEKYGGKKIVHTGRSKGRSRLIWMDDVADLRVMKIKQWTEKTIDREQWRLVVEGAKGHPTL